ncbi:MAG: POTRA domain-containing protein [candidate division WOR-3 bacterium]
MASWLAAQTILSVTATTQRADSLLVLQAAGLSPGDFLTREGLQEAIRHIYATGQFARVEVDTTILADGVRIHFRAQEFARLRPGGLFFVGNHKVGTRELVGKIGAKDRELLTEKKVFEWTQKISELYKNKGFILAKVTAQTLPADTSGEAELRFTIEEGDKHKIRKVTIKGTNSVPEGAVLKRMVNKSYSWPFRSGQFKDEEFKKDLERIVDFYKERGHLDATVLDYDLAYEQGWVNITITISEGLRYYFGQIDFQGESLYSQAELEPLLGARR